MNIFQLQTSLYKFHKEKLFVEKCSKFQVLFLSKRSRASPTTF